MRCPTCGSRQPSLHPSVGDGGEVTRLCPDSFHGSTSKAGKQLTRWADAAMFRSETMPVAENGRVAPKVYLLNAIPDPLGSLAAMSAMYVGGVKRSLSEVTDEERRTALREVFKNKLQGPLEVIQLHFLIEGVTRSFTHQAVRGRRAFYAQESLRFAVVEGEDWQDRVATPPRFEFWTPDQQAAWREAIEGSQAAYQELVDSGIPAEDARALMPHGMTTRIHWVVNLRELLYVAGVRLCTQAQFEWRSVMASVVSALREHTGHHYGPYRTSMDGWQWDAIADLLRPICYQEGKCGFKAQADRACSIRERVDANEQERRPSSEWGTRMIRNFSSGNWEDPDAKPNIEPIYPAEWLADPGAAR